MAAPRSILDPIPTPGIELTAPTLEVWSLSHWTTREVPWMFYIFYVNIVITYVSCIYLLITVFLRLFYKLIHEILSHSLLLLISIIIIMHNSTTTAS